MYKVFVTRRIPQAGLDLLAEKCDVEVYPEDGPLPREKLLEIVRDKHGVLGLLSDKIDAAFFDAAKELKGYANYAVGFDNIDVPEATRRGIPVSNTPDVLTEATAELSWALLFGVARRVAEGDRDVRADAWPGWGPLQYLGQGVTGKTLGIVGAGRIGAAMALMSKGFKMPVLYTNHSGRPNKTLEQELNAKLVPFEQLVRESDYISIHAPLTPDSRHMFNAATFKAMKSTVIIVNTGRGPVIDEAALVDALRNEEIAGAGLDVYEHEPALVEGLADLRNTVLLPHVGSATKETRDAMALLAARNLLAMLEGREPETCLNPEIYSS